MYYVSARKHRNLYSTECSVIAHDRSFHAPKICKITIVNTCHHRTLHCYCIRNACHGRCVLLGMHLILLHGRHLRWAANAGSTLWEIKKGLHENQYPSKFTKPFHLWMNTCSKKCTLQTRCKQFLHVFANHRACKCYVTAPQPAKLVLNKDIVPYKSMLGDRRSTGKRPRTCPIPTIFWNVTH